MTDGTTTSPGATEGRRGVTRRTFVAWVGGTAAGFFLIGDGRGWPARAVAAVPGGTMDPTTIPKYAQPLLIPPVMPMSGTTRTRSGKPIDLYEISLRQFTQQVLPAPLPATTVWGYGPAGVGGMHNAPSLTIEARVDRPVRVRWVNRLVDAAGNHLPHLLPVDPTLHWANPPGGTTGRDTRPMFDSPPPPYTGPVPMVTHVHGAVGVGDESDGYPEAWVLPAARDIPPGHANRGNWYDFFAAKARVRHGVSWGPGSATCQYPNRNRASTLWYHDHTLGMTRLNVYAGPAGFYIVRGGPDGDDAVTDARTGMRAALPGPAPRAGDRANKRYREIPLAIQDRAFNADGSLFYPDGRAFFDGVTGPFVGEAGAGMDAFSPFWNPEFFGNTLIVNGRTWPFLRVEQTRYRFRVLNGCQARFLIIDFRDIPGVAVWQLGNEGGFLPAPVDLASRGLRLLLAPAERADVIVDFGAVPVGSHVLHNVGPDEPFSGGEPSDAFETADPDTTGQVMRFDVVASVAADTSTPPQHLRLPVRRPLPAETVVRRLALIEVMGMGHDVDGAPAEGPLAAALGTVQGGGPVTALWMEPVTENPAVGATEVWEIHNTTADAHPIHLHEVAFEVVGREGLLLDSAGEVAVPITPLGNPRPPEPGELGVKDTVVAYPGEVTRLRARFTERGQFVWHCHIVEHEDNEMMRPMRIGPPQPGEPQPNGHAM